MLVKLQSIKVKLTTIHKRQLKKTSAGVRKKKTPVSMLPLFQSSLYLKSTIPGAAGVHFGAKCGHANILCIILMMRLLRLRTLKPNRTHVSFSRRYFKKSRYADGIFLSVAESTFFVYRRLDDTFSRLALRYFFYC